MKKITFLTLFPEVLEPFFKSSLLGKAVQSGLIEFECVQLRDFSQDKHRTVDDTPYGGGAGMLLKVEVLHAAWKSICEKNSTLKTHTVLFSPQGKILDQTLAKTLVSSSFEHLLLVCGHYEGVDERFIELCVDEEVSIGNYVLTGGELPALVFADTLVRLLPGVVGNAESVSTDSLENGQLKYPQYTKPREFQGLNVPEILLSGDHGKIKQWREEQSAIRTQAKRPDLKTSFKK